MQAMLKTLLLSASALAAGLALSSCKTLETLANNMNESALGSGGSALAVGGGSYFVCKLGGGSDRDCAIVAGTAGLATYAYLKNQANKMAKIDNVMATPCSAKDSSKQAYCVNMTEQAVTFSSGSASLNSGSQLTLSQVAEVLRESDDTVIYIEGHTDPTGSEDFNQTLSDKRAQSVKSFFASQGIGEERMIAFGWGETKPLPVSPPSNTAQRRVELRVEGGAN